MSDQVVYPGAPVVLVALEIRHPTASTLTPSESRAIKALIKEDLPIERAGHISTMNVLPTGPEAASTERFPQFVNRQQTMAVSFRREAVVVEVTGYPGWLDFSRLVMKALHARMSVAPFEGIERVGLRYINEVRVPNDEHPAWQEWINASLLGPDAGDAVGDLPLQLWQTAAVYGTGQVPGKTLVFRYGPREGSAVEQNGELIRVKPMSQGQYFLMDIDSYWTKGTTIPEFDTALVIAMLDDLHGPVRKLFEHMITPTFKKEVLET